MKTTVGNNNTVRGKKSAHPGKDESLISLQLLVNQFLGKCMTEAHRTKSIIVNHVSRDIKITRETAMVAPVIRELMNIVARNAYKGDISVAAERFRDIIILKIQDRNNYNGYALVSSLNSLEPDVLLSGGNITVEGAQQKMITVSFSFSGNADHSIHE